MLGNGAGSLETKACVVWIGGRLLTLPSIMISMPSLLPRRQMTSIAFVRRRRRWWGRRLQLLPRPPTFIKYDMIICANNTFIARTIHIKIDQTLTILFIIEKPLHFFVSKTFLAFSVQHCGWVVRCTEFAGALCMCVCEFVPMQIVCHFAKWKF